ncbi:putative bifunctional diguanylate cyclase/phosphodiesterase [Actinoplanes sp. NPDC049265]|uniref:putative bifunctional diguanylate cyclase/phosphodiesterase n=1 Tax=Actinoplanes sp. NPDC049265 TaxID=3363902 RepID=UPI003721FADF
MTRKTGFNDDVADKRLSLLVSFVVVAGGVAVLSALVAAWSAPRPSVMVSAGIICAIAVGSRTQWRVRIRSHTRGISWPEVGVLIGLAVLSPPWLILCTCAAVAMAKLTTGLAPQKALFGVAKDVLAAAVAGLVYSLFPLTPNADHPVLQVGALATAALAMWVVDESLGNPVIALAMRVSLWTSLRTDWDMRVLGTVARYAVATLVVGILSLGGDARLLLLVLPIVVCVHLWQTAQVRNREERQSWQRLAETTDELNVVDLTAVLEAAVTRSAQLFSVDEVDIELSDGESPRLVRGTTEGVVYDGPPADAPGRDGAEITRQLAGHIESNPVGELRLRVNRSISLTPSETYKLKTFASALYTAIRNATAYAELERMSREYAYDAAHDPLTGLANRRELLDQAGRMFTERPDEGMLALLLIDLNHFKEVNDTLGHAAGDEVLREVAVRLQDAARPADLVARLGGDEFAVLLTGLPSPAMARHRADSLLAAFDRTIDVDGMRLTVEACGGIALAPGSGGVTELLRRADVAMYQAKRSGQRTVDYAHSRDTADVGRLMLGGEVRRAVAELEFSVDFQPIVDLGSGEVVAAEALARWHHPEHGDLTPVQFLETIERSGQLPAFADAVLEQSLSAADTWREAGFDIPVAVNVSPRSLLDPDFPKAVRSRLGSHGVPSDRLVLELAETLTISQLEVVERALAELRAAGVRLVLDDFGAGVSPLSVLSRIPLHQLKIGREFVAAVETSDEAAAVIRSTVDLARSLHLTVIADGVESEPQRAALWELGCVAGQGHLFARPMRGRRILAALQRGTGGRPGVLAGALHDAGSVVRLPRRRPPGPHRSSLPHLPA